MTSLPHRLDRTVVIQATPETVFRFFTDSARWARWWGTGSTIDARPGGRVFIRHPNGIEAGGEIVEVAAPDRIVFTYGFASGKPMPIGGSRVTIRLEKQTKGTTLHLQHDFADAIPRDEHVQGWRFQLSLFANAVSDEVNAGATGLVDQWFDAWAERDSDACARALAAIATEEVTFRDRYSQLAGIADLLPHIAAAQRFTNLRVTRHGDVRHCQGTVLADWVATGADGQEKAAGLNVFVLNADGRIESVTGFWGPPKPAA
jgi:uncharacterized protein YndB with AHSA1/START domain